MVGVFFVYRVVPQSSCDMMGSCLDLLCSIRLMEEILHHLGYINLVKNGRNYISTGAGFLPSTVVPL